MKVINHHNRLNPSDFATETLDSLSAVLARPGHITLVDEEGHRAELPAPLVQLLLRVARLMEKQRTLILIPEDETFTTQADRRASSTSTRRRPAAGKPTLASATSTG